MRAKTSKLAALVVALAAAGSVLAANDDATFAVTANIASQCVVGNTTAMAFGDLAMLNLASGGLSTAKNNATATFDTTCTNGTGAPTLKFASANGGGTAFKMRGGSGSDTITYTLYEGATDAGTSIAHDTLAAYTGFAADGTVKSLSVTGQVAAADKNGKPIGAYSDTVTITVGFTPD
ncbi:spore coat protein U domain-containing protein [Ramlibacter albus]|uniref:Spore coat protein U domain-containing protein n=1 Tax=Ramlibacter albus TaxID=2079448 RepID=A0A923MC46_9BURK|nr:spore coat protein U domain-containing protein [Ramlibacter albus]MBC5767658.1 spore coat protein U domain-containing protein [Ramlibacter albus]